MQPSAFSKKVPKSAKTNSFMCESVGTSYFKDHHLKGTNYLEIFQNCLHMKLLRGN